MSILDWLVLLPIAAYFLWLLFRPKKNKCTGCCESCSCRCK